MHRVTADPCQQHHVAGEMHQPALITGSGADFRQGRARARGPPGAERGVCGGEGATSPRRRDTLPRTRLPTECGRPWGGTRWDLEERRWTGCHSRGFRTPSGPRRDPAGPTGRVGKGTAEPCGGGRWRECARQGAVEGRGRPETGNREGLALCVPARQGTGAEGACPGPGAAGPGGDGRPSEEGRGRVCAPVSGSETRAREARGPSQGHHESPLSHSSRSPHQSGDRGTGRPAATAAPGPSPRTPAAAHAGRLPTDSWRFQPEPSPGPTAPFPPPTQCRCGRDSLQAGPTAAGLSPLQEKHPARPQVPGPLRVSRVVPSPDWDSDADAVPARRLERRPPSWGRSPGEGTGPRPGALAPGTRTLALPHRVLLRALLRLPESAFPREGTARRSRPSAVGRPCSQAGVRAKAGGVSPIPPRRRREAPLPPRPRPTCTRQQAQALRVRVDRETQAAHLPRQLWSGPRWTLPSDQLGHAGRPEGRQSVRSR